MLNLGKADYDVLIQNGCKPSVGDVLLTKDGTVGKTAIVEDNNFVVLSSIAILSPNNDLLYNRYLKYWLDSCPSQFEMESVMAGSALRRVILSKIKSFVLVLPPFEEQVKISDYLDSIVPILDSLISMKLEILSKLDELKQSVVYEYVTGKKQVP